MKQVGGIIALLGLVFAIVSFREGIAGLKKPIDLYADETNISEIGYFDMVTVDVFEVYGSFATRTTTENGKKTSEESYYLIPAHEGDEYRYIGIRVPEKEYKIYDKIYKDTYDYYETGVYDTTDYGMVKTGCLKKMKKEMQDYYYSTLKKAEWFEDDATMKAEALPYYLDPIENRKAPVGMLFGGIIAFLVGGILFIFGARGEKKKFDRKAEQTYVVINGISYAKADLARVNQLLQGQEKVFATQELARITGLSLEEAGKITEHWREYYY